MGELGQMSGLGGSEGHPGGANGSPSLGIIRRVDGRARVRKVHRPAPGLV